MDIYTKKQYLMKSLDSLIDHDDAPIGAIEEALAQAVDHMDAKLSAARARRAAKEAAQQG